MAEGLHGNAEGPVIPASAETLLRFQIGKAAGAEEQPDAPVYLLAAPTPKLQRAYQAALTARGFRYPTDAELMSEVRVWLDDLRHANTLNPEDGISESIFDRRMTDIERFHERQVQLVEEAQKKLQAMAEAVTDNDAEAVTKIANERLSREDQLILDRYNQLRRIASEEYPRVKAIDEHRTRYLEANQKVAASIALRGWEGLPGVVEVLGTEASAATMAQLDDETQDQIGAFWLAQSRLTEAQKKTSDSPPPSSTTPTTTPEAGSSPPSSTAVAVASRRSRATRSGMKPSTPIPVT